ncbi:MAG: ribosome maturation factor RimP [Deltaproteobacteria bacterium]|nr:ribosome maturation factor RimP [Deltaproteobacteria bacterium]
MDFVYRVFVPVIESAGLELAEVTYRKERRGWVLRLFVDRAEIIGRGVTLDECARLSRELSVLLDVEDLISHEYVLEVSSPGLDRPLKTSKDFLRFSGKKVRVTTKAPLASNSPDHRRNFLGVIKGAAEENVTLECEDGLFTIPIDLIDKAKLEIEI